MKLKSSVSSTSFGWMGRDWTLVPSLTPHSPLWPTGNVELFSGPVSPHAFSEAPGHAALNQSSLASAHDLLAGETK